MRARLLNVWPFKTKEVKKNNELSIIESPGKKVESDEPLTKEEFLATVDTLAKIKYEATPEYEKLCLQILTDILKYIEANKNKADAFNALTPGGNTLFAVITKIDASHTRRKLTRPIVEALLALPIISEIINYPDSSGVTPLIGAMMAKTSSTEIFGLLLKKIEDDHIPDKSSVLNFALNFAAMHGKLEVVRLLIKTPGVLEDWNNDKNKKENYQYIRRAVEERSAYKNAQEEKILKDFKTIEDLLLPESEKKKESEVQQHHVTNILSLLREMDENLKQDFYLVSQLSKDKKYINCYVFVNTEEEKKLYYFDTMGKPETIQIADYTTFPKLEEKKEDKLRFTAEELSSLITNNQVDNRNIFLTSLSSVGETYEISDRDNLYLYRNPENKEVFYFIKNNKEPQYIKNNEFKFPENVAFTSTKEHPIKCENQEIIQAIFKITVIRGHINNAKTHDIATFVNNEEKQKQFTEAQKNQDRSTLMRDEKLSETTQAKKDKNHLAEVETKSSYGSDITKSAYGSDITKSAYGSDLTLPDEKSNTPTYKH